MSDPSCVRCELPVVASDDSSWSCPTHGAVEPLQPARSLEPQEFLGLARASRVPLWVPWPMPSGWALTGIRSVGDTRSPARGVAIACSGPGVVSRADLIIVAEEPGVGLGARFAGIEQTDPGPEVVLLPADVKVHADGHAAVLWSVPGVSDRAAYVGEASGLWLWVVVWPVTEWMVVHDNLRLTDLCRRVGNDRIIIDLAFGPPTPMVSQPPPPQIS